MIDSMTRPLSAVAERDANRRLGEHLLAVVRAQDAVIPAHRRAPRTVAEMRARLARMANDACPLCGRWSCNPAKCPSVAPAPATATATASASGGGQCSRCGGWFPGWPGGVCGSCQATGR